MPNMIRATICIDVNARDQIDLEEIIGRWYGEISLTTTSRWVNSAPGTDLIPLLQNWDVVIEPVKDEEESPFEKVNREISEDLEKLLDGKQPELKFVCRQDKSVRTTPCERCDCIWEVYTA